jgi:hypothetical protein
VFADLARVMAIRSPSDWCFFTVKLSTGLTFEGLLCSWAEMGHLDCDYRGYTWRIIPLSSWSLALVRKSSKWVIPYIYYMIINTY